MLYKFFDYKYNISGFESDLFSTPHIIYIVLAVLSVYLIYLLRNVKHNKIDIYLKILSIFAFLLEITKITWESYYDITTGRGFNIGGILPIYTCSLFIYTSLLAAWTTGKTKEVALSFLTTVSLIAGIIGVIYCNGLNYYPFWTFGAFYSLFFHYFMFATGMLLLITGYKKLTTSDIYKSWIPVVILSVIAIPVNYILHSDYMQLYDGSGIPLYSDLASYLGNHGLRWIFTILMLLTYMPLAGVVIGGYKGIEAISTASKKKSKKALETA